MEHIQKSDLFKQHLDTNKSSVGSMKKYIARINRRIAQLQQADNRTMTTTDSATLMRQWTVESHKRPMFIAPITSSGDIPFHVAPDDHRRRDYHYTLRHIDAILTDPIPLIHWPMAYKGIYEKCLANPNKKKRPGTQKQQAPNKRPTHTKPATDMLSIFLQQQQEMTRIMKGHLAPQAAMGLMDDNWTSPAPPLIGAPAYRSPDDLRNFSKFIRQL